MSTGSGKKCYPQKFRSQWLEDPLLADWLTYEDVEEGHKDSARLVRRPKCFYCNQLLTLRYMDLTKHAQTEKHKKNRQKVSGPITLPQKKDKNKKVLNLSEFLTDEEPSHEIIQIEDVKDTSAHNVIVSESSQISVMDEEADPESEGEFIQTPGESNTEDFNTLKVERMKVLLEQERLKLYLLQLDALEKEKKLGLFRSKYTKDL